MSTKCRRNVDTPLRLVVAVMRATLELSFRNEAHANSRGAGRFCFSLRIGPESPIVGRIWVKLGRNWADSSQTPPNSVRILSTSANICRSYLGRVRPSFDRLHPALAKSRLKFARSGPGWTEQGPNSANLASMSVDTAHSSRGWARSRADAQSLLGRAGRRNHDDLRMIGECSVSMLCSRASAEAL